MGNNVKLTAVRELYINLVSKSILGETYPDKTGYKHPHNWPKDAHTMLNDIRVDNIIYCMTEIINNGISGDVIETGVWRGGSCILMRAILKAYQITDKKVYVADSFEGLPKPHKDLYPKDDGDDNWTYKELAIPIEEVMSNFKAYGLLDEQVVFKKGWFKDTLPGIESDNFSLIRLDGDMYESTWQALEALYKKLSIGGFCIIDDYELLRSRWAMEDFRKKYDIQDELIIFDVSAYWKKTKQI